jgi:signal transduction histidine kinase
MRLKLLAGSALVLFFVSFISVALAAPPVPGAATVAKLLLISLLAAPALGLLVMIPLMRSILAPVRDLISGTNRIARGDLNVQAPVTTSDELGELAISFNEMVVGLREREVLREQNADLVQELTASRARIVTAADAARRQIERDLHDGAQQRLVLVDLKLALAERLLDSDPDAAKAAHTELRHDLEHALRELRDLAHGIYPAVLENEGLTAALGEATTGAAIPVELRSNGISRYPPQIEAAIYFCCLEALQNAAKHAGQGARAEVRLRDSDGRLRFDVVDNGAGFEPAAAAASSGLQNMTDRIGALGGTLHIQSTPGAGTTITGSIPI